MLLETWCRDKKKLTMFLQLCNGIACFNTLIIYQHKQLIIFRMFNTTELSIYTCLRLIGTVQYLGKFVKGLTDLTAPLRELTRKDSEFTWNESHTKAERAIHVKLSNAPVLRYYDMAKSVTIQADASQTGLGAALMQDGQPISYASRAMTDTEQNYAQIEKELLAIVFACERFNDYIYGRNVVHVETDHKPL